MFLKASLIFHCEFWAFLGPRSFDYRNTWLHSFQSFDQASIISLNYSGLLLVFWSTAASILAIQHDSRLINFFSFVNFLFLDFEIYEVSGFSPRLILDQWNSIIVKCNGLALFL